MDIYAAGKKNKCSANSNFKNVKNTYFIMIFTFATLQTIKVIETGTYRFIRHNRNYTTIFFLTVISKILSWSEDTVSLYLG